MKLKPPVRRRKRLRKPLTAAEMQSAITVRVAPPPWGAERPPQSLIELAEKFDQLVLPAAIALGMVPTTGRLRDVRDFGPAEYASLPSLNPELIALSLLRRFARMVDAIQRLEKVDDWALAAAVEHMAYLDGYLQALLDSRRARAAPANKRRRAIGAAKDARIQTAAEPYRGAMTREQAAEKIAAEVGAAVSTIQRRLSELYPGNEWRPSES